VENTGTLDYDFATNPVTFSIRVTEPEPFSFDTVFSTGEIKSGETLTLELTDVFPIVAAGRYNIEVFFNSSVDNIKYDDTVRAGYVSGKFGLPRDEDFSNGMPTAFIPKGLNTTDTWKVIPQGTEADTVVKPQFGTGMLAYKGSQGSMATFSTQRLDLSRTIKPSLSFWYFHDTVPCEDYTDVRMTVDGGLTYRTLFSLTKYDATYGWKQYSINLPDYAVDECVILVFEAMEKSRSGNVTQYIDRIRITAKRDIELSEVLTSKLSACNMENKEWKVVLTNHTAPFLDYSDTTVVTLEITGTGQSFTQSLTSGILAGFTSDTISLAPTFNFAKGTYQVKAYFSSVLDDTPMNDTLEKSITVDPDLSVELKKVSTSDCLTGDLAIYQEVVLKNTGNMDLSNIELVLQIDTGSINLSPYTILTEIYTDTIAVMESATYEFSNPYIVPWNTNYYVRVTANLECNVALSDKIDEITECVDTKDLSLESIDNPSSSIDNVGSSIQVRATLRNRSDLIPCASLDITFVVTNSQGIETDKFTEKTGAINISATVNHNFTHSYIVPNDSIYYLTVYIDSSDNYHKNDTVIDRRTTNYTGINRIEKNGFTLEQNMPNPAKKVTHINYTVPETDKIIFRIHNITGQLLYSKTIEASRGTNSIELNTSRFAAGIYFYSMEYKGQRLIKRMSVK
jgi:hypothetical protein